VIEALNSAGYGSDSAQVSATPVPAGTAKVLFIVDNASSLSQADSTILTRLQNLTYTVTVESAATSQSTDATGKALVVLSGSINPPDVTTKFTNVSVPVLTWNTGLFNYLGMTGPNSGTDFGTTGSQSQIAVWNYSDPIIVGITGLTQPVSVVNSADTFSWGVPNGYASIGATLASDTTKATIFSYKQGVTMPGGIAPARRVGFFMTQNTATNLNASGQSLFDAAVQWSMGAPDSTFSVWANVASGQVTLNWDSSAGATNYKVERATSPNGPFTVIASNATGTSFVDTGLTDGTTYYYRVTALNGTGQSAPSAAISAVPTASTVTVAITGTRYLRRKLPGEANDVWNTATFTALVYRGGNQVPDSSILLTGWTCVGGLGVNSPVTFNGTPATSSCSISSLPNIQGPARVTYKIRVITGPGQIEDVPPVTFSVFVVPKYLVNMTLHFPNDGNAKRTSRAGYDLWNTVDTTRSVERSRLATDFQNALPSNWHQAAIDYYFVTVKNDIAEALGTGVYAGDNLLAGDARGLVPAALMQAMINQNQGSSIHVYLVHQLQGVQAGVTAVTIQDMRRGSSGCGIFLDDGTIPSTSTLAHELGHIWNLDEEDKQLPPIAGTVNNLMPIYGNPGAFTHYLMTSTGRLESWLSEKEGVQSRYYVDVYARQNLVLGAEDQ
jgi:hypothetical protein